LVETQRKGRKRSETEGLPLKTPEGKKHLRRRQIRTEHQFVKKMKRRGWRNKTQKTGALEYKDCVSSDSAGGIGRPKPEK